MPIEKVDIDIVIGSAAEDSIANHDSLKLLVDLGSGTGEHLVSQSGNVNSGIRFSSEPSITSNILGILNKETLKEVEGIKSSGVVGGFEAGEIGV